MTIRAVLALILCAPSLASAAVPAEPEPACAVPAGERELTWRQAATEDDRRRLREWRSAFVDALGEARGSGHAAEIAREGALLEPDVAMAGAALPEGEYRCRTIKLGSQGQDGLDYVAYPWFRCRVAPGADGFIHFTRLGGSQRPVGRLFAEHDRRQIFLGTMQLGDESRALRYGRDRQRNLAGIVERIGESRWRILFPYPHFESTLDVIELAYAP